MMAQELNLDAVQAKLKAWFESKMPHGCEVWCSPLRKASAGLSNQTFMFDIQFDEGGKRKLEKLVVRWAPLVYVLFPKYNMEEQFLIMKHLGNTGVPVPGARWFEEDKSVIGSPFYIVDEVEGWIPCENPPYHIMGPLFDATPEYRVKIWWQAIDALVKIHSIDWKKAGLSFLGVPKGGTDPIDQHVAYYEKMLHGTEGPPQPILEATLDWLKKNSFAPKHVSLCWGDARLSNLIYHNDKLAAVLDWEMAVLGDAESDLLWLLHMDWAVGAAWNLPRLEGLPSKEETIEYYERAMGRKVENAFYHDVFATFRIGVIYNKLEPILYAVGYITPDIRINTAQLEKLQSLLGL
jgi:aminoglycoside phosphotransferase (APT) family kinase protein